jgi:hypothetical protein
MFFAVIILADDDIWTNTKQESQNKDCFPSTKKFPFCKYFDL